MRLWVLFCLMVSFIFAAATGTAAFALEGEAPLLRGVVFDEGQRGLPGVAVSVWDGSVIHKALSDFDGNFTISGLLPGKPFAVRWTPRGGASVKVDAITFPSEGDLCLSMDFGSVGRGNAYTVRLPSNPSTGHGWKALHKGVAVVRLTENTFKDSEDLLAARAVAGRPGTEVWKYEAVAPGKTTIIFSYNRSWEKGVIPSRYHILAITVR